MAGQEGLEGGLRRLITPVRESLEQLAVGQADGAAGTEEPTEVSPKVLRRCARHVLPSAREPTLLILLFPMAGRRNTLFSRRPQGEPDDRTPLFTPVTVDSSVGPTTRGSRGCAKVAKTYGSMLGTIPILL